MYEQWLRECVTARSSSQVMCRNIHHTFLKQPENYDLNCLCLIQQHVVLCKLQREEYPDSQP